MIKTIKLVFHIIFVSANVLVVLLFILAAYSDKISPEKSILMAFLGLGFPILLVGTVGFCLWWLLRKKWKYFFLCVASLLVCWGPVKRYYPMHGKTKDVPEENVVKVLTYNVMNFGNKEHTASSPNKIVEYIANSGADIVCLQEYAVVRSGKGLTGKALFKALDMYPYRSVFQLSYSNSLAVFSKYPLSNSRQIKYKGSFNGSSVHDVDIDGKKLTLINNHLESFKLTMKDRSQYASVIRNLDSDALNNLGGSFLRKLASAFRQRARQADIIAGEIGKASTEYVLVCGDFNDTPISYTHDIIQGEMVDAFTESGRGGGHTYNQNFFWFRIDHIIHSSNIRSYNCTVGDVKFSDHYPVWCYLELK